MPRPKFTMSAQLFLWLVPLLYVYISDAKTLAFFLRPVGTVAEPRQGFFDSIQQTFLPIFVFFFVRSRLLCGWGHEIAPQQLNNADDKNGNEDDPRPKKAGGRQISQRAWQMVRSSKIKRGAPAPASHRNSPPSAENPFTSLNLDVSLLSSPLSLSLSLVLFFTVSVLSLSVCLSLNTDFVRRQHQLQQFDICGQRRGRRPVLDLPCRESRTTRLGHGRHFETRRPM